MKTILTLLGCSVFTLIALSHPMVSKAQNSVQCGTIIQGEFSSNNQVQEYSVQLDAGQRLIASAEVSEGYSDLTVGVGITSPTNFVIHERPGGASYSGMGKLVIIPTDILTDSGAYTISIIGGTQTRGNYTLSVICVNRDGTVTSNSKYVKAAPCGSIIANEYTRNNEIHRYYLSLEQRDKLSISAVVSEGYSDLTVGVGITSPTNFVIHERPGRAGYSGMNKVVNISTDGLSDSGVYIIEVIGGTETRGNYTLSIGCTLRDGTVIEPGDPIEPEQSPPGPPPATPAFSGTGFPGLAPVDFANVSPVPIAVGSGVITPTGSEILAYTLDANANDVLDLTFTRVTGNLNLGLVVLSADNQVVFQASLVTSTTLNTRFTLPSAGQYTIGVFRIDLLPPAAPEATAFQVQGTLNP